mgnify:CR=1 FL=1
MARTAGKSKTHKAISKRVKVTGTGKMLRHKQGKRHLLINKNRKRKRNLGKATLVSADFEEDQSSPLAFSIAAII